MRKIYPQSPLEFGAKQLKHAVVLAIVLFVIVLPVKLFAQTPTISYNGPQTYTAGTTIAPLVPTSSGVAPFGYSTNPVPIGAGFISGPYAVAADAAGNVYMTDQVTGSVKEIPAGGGVPATVATGFSQPTGVAVDAAGNVYVLEDAEVNTVYKIPAGGGTRVSIAAGFSNASGIAADAAGNVYVANGDTTKAFGGEVYKIPVGGGSPLILASFHNDVLGVAVDAAGNVYAVFGIYGTVRKIPFGGGAPFSIASGVGPGGITVDGAGNLFVSNGIAVQEIPVNSSTPIYIDSGFYAPIGVAVDGAGNLYVADASKGLVSEIKPVGGYHIGPFLPAGLSFNSATGVISGTPATVSPATNYTITAYNSAGVSKTATVNIEVTGNAYLSALKMSAGSISPSFTKTTNSYSATVAQSKTSTTVTPTAQDPTATITVNGIAVVSGQASTAIPLAVGANDILIIVTASDKVTTNTYHITVFKPASTNDNLAKLSLSAGALSPAFAAGTNSYTTSIAGVSGIQVTPTAADPSETITVNGATVASGQASGAIALNIGYNTISVVVTAQDGVTKKTYTVIVGCGNNDAYLSNLKVTTATLSPAFAFKTLAYTCTVSNSTNAVTVTPSLLDAAASITVNGISVANKTASGPIALAAGTNTVNIVVVAQDGLTKQTYKLTITRDAAGTNNAYLSNLKIATATLSPAFNFKTFAYTSTVANSTESVTVTPSLLDAAASVTVNGINVASKTASGPIALAVGTNTINVMVIAEDGITTNIYTVTITRATGPVNGFDPGLSVNNPAEHPVLNDNLIVVHNGLSPNGDGVNDFLQIDNIGWYPENKLSIMNRNGQLIYEAQGYDNSSKIFDGHSNQNGQMQLPGTYFYQLDYTVNGIVRHKTGFIVLKY